MIFGLPNISKYCYTAFTQLYYKVRCVVYILSCFLDSNFISIVFLDDPESKDAMKIDSCISSMTKLEIMLTFIGVSN